MAHLTEKKYQTEEKRIYARLDTLREERQEILRAADALGDVQGTDKGYTGAAARDLYAFVAKMNTTEERLADALLNLDSIFTSDRNRFYLAMADLKAAGIVTSLGEARDGLKRGKIEDAEENGTPRVWTYRNRMTDVFDGNAFATDSWTREFDEVWDVFETWTDEETGETGTDRTFRHVGPNGDDVTPWDERGRAKGVYLYHGPDAATAEKAKAIFEARGLGVSWDGSTGSALFVSTPERALRHSQAEERARLAREAEKVGASS